MRSKLFHGRIDETSEHFLAGLLNKYALVYHVLILFIVVAFISLAVLSININVASDGVLRAEMEVNQIKASSIGIVGKVLTFNNQDVNAGQLLFSVQSPILEERIRFAESKIKEINNFIADLDYLLEPVNRRLDISIVSSSSYQQSLSDYLQKLNDKQIRLQKVTQDFSRNKKLYEQRVIATADFENFEFEYKRAINEMDLLKQSQLSTWQQELQKYKLELLDVDNQLTQLQKEKEALNIYAPISGTIQNLTGVYPGSPIFAGQELAQISPGGELIAEIYASPNDIGFLKVGMRTRMHVSAFHYHQWGLLEGVVKDISNDVMLVNNQPVFKVRCSLKQDFLTLKSGYVGKLKKGMTVQARFLVAERTLWQLLFDKADDWLNPNIKN
jgi:membrane fusion protein, peptide pheromone/bacteriocin exporter